MRLKPYNIGTCWKGLRISFHLVPLFSKSFHFWVSFITFCNFLKIPSVLKELNLYWLTFQLFKGKFYYCLGPTAIYVKNKTHCLSDHRNIWQNQKYNFDNLGQVCINEMNEVWCYMKVWNWMILSTLWGRENHLGWWGTGRTVSGIRVVYNMADSKLSC
jgi:fumarate reductase subunit C